MNIGKFQKQENGNFQGSIRTLTINIHKVEMVPVENPSEKGPHYRFYTDGLQIGAGWLNTSEKGNAYISVKIDDPSFAAPLSANLFEDGDNYNMVWKR